MARGPRSAPEEQAGRGGGAAPGPGTGDRSAPEPEAAPPLGSWRRLYAVVIAELALVILLCGWLSRLGR